MPLLCTTQQYVHGRRTSFSSLSAPLAAKFSARPSPPTDRPPLGSARSHIHQLAPPVQAAPYSPTARVNASLSIFTIIIIACIAFPALTGSGSEIISISIFGSICHDTPK